jgi:hypothetical protein
MFVKVMIIGICALAVALVLLAAGYGTAGRVTMLIAACIVILGGSFVVWLDDRSQ